MSKRKSSWPIGGASASVTSGSGCRVTDEILRRQAEEIRAEVARLAPHWVRYEQDRAAARANWWKDLPHERGNLTTEGKRRMADLNWRYEQAADLHLMSEEFYQRNTPVWKKFTNCLRNLFTR